jgi:DNA modification methylase
MLSSSDTLFLPGLRESKTGLRRIIPWQRWGEGGGMSFTRRSLVSRDHLVLADSLALLNVLPDGCIDLAYIDPPFATGKFRESPLGDDGPNGFDDSWGDVAEFVQWLKPRLSEIWRVLSDNGSLVIHLDSRAIHNVRIVCDSEFGADRWENEIIWHYTGGGRSRTRFSRKHDVLLWYSKGRDRIFNIDAVREPYKPTSGYAKGGIVSKKGKKYMPHPEGTPADDVWDIPIVNPMSKERTAYPTQKPLPLMERIVAALSAPDSIVGDFFSGSGTTALACRSLGRKFLCCDDNPDAIGVALSRLAESNPVERPAAVLSHGLYRISALTPEAAETSALEFSVDGLRMQANVNPRLLQPSWKTGSDPPDPLAQSDFILDIRNRN